VSWDYSFSEKALKQLRKLGQGVTVCGWKIGGEADGEHTRRRVFRAAPSLPGGRIHGLDGIKIRIQAVIRCGPSFRRGRRIQHARRVRSPRNGCRIEDGQMIVLVVKVGHRKDVY